MEKQGTLRHLKPVEIFPCGTGMCTSVSTMIVTSIFRELISVFNLEISQSGAYVLHGTLNWVISKN